MTKMEQNLDAMMDQMVADELLKRDKAEALMNDNPGLPFLSAYVMASDYVGMERVQREVRAGEHEMTETLPIYVGSYARMDFICWLYDEGFIPKDKLLEWFSKHWSAADPNDTNIRFLDLWREVNKRWRNDGPGTPYFRDSPKYLPAVTGTITVYRGQRMTDPTGWSWSLRPDVARKFAISGGGRAPVKDGLVIKGKVKVSDVLAYLTERNEDEVIVPPTFVR